MSTVTIYEDGVPVEVDAADPRVPVVVQPAPPPRTVAFTALVDALSSDQYVAIDPRDRDRMQSENGGVVPFSSSKVKRAAAKLGMTPDDLFKLAGA